MTIETQLPLSHELEAVVTDHKQIAVVTFENIGIRIDDGSSTRPILRGVSGTIRPGLTAIMGPTGSGKTTLLNALLHHVSVGLEKVSGEVRLNGKVFTPQQVHFGYCLQTDDLNGHLTVYETLYYAAELLFAFRTSEERHARVMEVLRVVGLVHVRDVMVGSQTHQGISGGQRKRVSIALALLSAPPLLILDEPTAGLDSVTAMNLMEELKELATNHGTTILCVIHQPQRKIFELLDRLILLRSGEIIFDDEASSCVAAFEALGLHYDGVSNPADHIMDVISPHLGETQAQLWDRCVVRKAYRKPEVDHNANGEQPLPLSAELPSRAYQFGVLFRRHFVEELRDINLHLLSFFVAITAGFLIGGVWFQLGNGTANLSKRSPCVFFTVINQSLFGAMKSVLGFPEQRRTLMRERRAKLYTTLPGFLSWSLVDMLFSIPWSLVFVLVTYFMIGLRTDSAGHFFIFMVVLILDKIVASSMAVMVCTWTTNPSVPTVILPVVLELSRLFGGFFLPPALLPNYFEWLDPLSYVKYAYLAVANNELQDLLICTPAGVCSTTAANAIITSNKIDYLTPGPCIGVLIAFIVFTRFVAYVFLLFKKN